MKKVFKYMGWPWDRPGFTPSEYKPDGNDMVLCISAMRDWGDYPSFYKYAMDKYLDEFMVGVDVKLFGNPEKFFELMEAWREEVENEKRT
jgi:hypothetical protein